MYFLSSQPQIGDFANQFSWLENLGITLVFETEEDQPPNAAQEYEFLSSCC